MRVALAWLGPASLDDGQNRTLYKPRCCAAGDARLRIRVSRPWNPGYCTSRRTGAGANYSSRTRRAGSERTILSDRLSSWPHLQVLPGLARIPDRPRLVGGTLVGPRLVDHPR